MNIVEDFDAYRSAAYTTEYGPIGSAFSDEVVIIEPSAVGSIPSDVPLLSVDTTVKQTSRGRGAVVCVSCSNDTVVVATSKGFIIRYYWDEYGNEKVTEVEVSKHQDCRILNIFLDPMGSHVVASTKVQGAWEAHYVHRRWPKTKAITKLKGTCITAVAWTRPSMQDDDLDMPPERGSMSHASISDFGGLTDSSTGPMILGTDMGLLYELTLDERHKKDPAPKQLFDFKDRRKAICSLYQETIVGGTKAVLVATPLYLYVFTGGPQLEAVFAKYALVAVSPVLEAVAASLHSKLHLYSSDGVASVPSRFAWLVGSMVYHGDLDLQGGSDSANMLHNITSLPLPDAAGNAEDDHKSMVMTEYHFIVLAADRLQAINRVSGRLVSEVNFKSPLSKSIAGGEGSRAIDGLVRDSVTGTIYMYSDESLYEVAVRQEARDMWRVYLELQDWDEALKLCSNSAQRDEVHRSHADTAFAAGDHNTAAVHYAKIVSPHPPFEDIALKFIDAGATEALQLYLSTKLSVLSKMDRAQATMAAAWLTELYLDQLNKELLEASGQHTAKYLACEQQLQEFLQSFVEVLDVNTTTMLLATYGRLDELMSFAAARGDHEAVLEYLMQRPQGASRALAVLRKPSCSQELVYKFAPGLISASTEETIDFLITAKPPLDARRLIPALLRYGNPGSSPESRRHVLRYVEFAIDQLGTTDSAVHNLAVALHALSPNESTLLSYLNRARNALGVPLFDPKYALRLAMERGKHRACVKLLCELGMYEDAVKLALSVDLELAQSVANQPEDDDAMRRKLWLAVARHVVQSGGGGTDQAASIKQAVEFLKEAGGLLKIEDILPFFPDFVTIDNFKDAICESLERYNRQIEELKQEMEDATDIADAVRRDLKLLATRTATLRLAEPCARCGRPIADPPPPMGLPSGGAIQQFFLFPTGLLYHGVCCAAEVVDLANPQQQAKIEKLLSRLAKAKTTTDAKFKSLQQQLAAEVAAEDPRNGEITVRMVDKPFIVDSDRTQFDSWVI